LAKVKMTPSEAFVETLVAEGVKEIFGIVGSAYMDAQDILADAGIRFISVAHEQAACHAADGLARVTGRPQTCIIWPSTNISMSSRLRERSGGCQ
jgi:sulfoacetaldehyde acetyltransferase